MKHQILQEAAKKLGSQAALARHLGVNQTTLSRWINLRDTPAFLACLTTSNWSEDRWFKKRGPCREYNDPYWTRERIDQFERKLFALTEKTLDEIFPSTDFVDAMPDLAPHTPSLVLVSEASQESMVLPDPSSLAEANEFLDGLEQNILKVVNSLSFRQRQAVILYFGLKGHRNHTLRELADYFHLKSIEGARCVLRKALNTLSDAKRSARLAKHLH